MFEVPFRSALIFGLLSSCGHCFAALDWAVRDTHSQDAPTIVNVHLGWISLSDYAVPIYLVLDRQSSAVDSFFGVGWLCPIISSRCIAIDENILYFETPDGKVGCSALDNDGKRCSGTAEWAIDIRRNVVTLESRIDKSSVTYRNGKISVFRLGNGEEYTVLREQSQVSLQKDGVSLFTVERRNANEVEVRAKTIGAQVRIGKRPFITRVSGTDCGVVNALVSSVERVQVNDFSSVAMTYGENPKDLSELVIEWKDSNFITEWNYRLSDNDLLVVPAKPKAHFPDAMALFDPTIQASDFMEVAEFASGPLAGRIRLIGCVSGNQRKEFYRASYDERGLIMREKIGKWTRRRDTSGLLTLYDENMNPRKIYRIADNSIRVEKIENSK